MSNRDYRMERNEFTDGTGGDQDGGINRQYKDRLFKAIFGAQERRHMTLQVYNVLNGSSYTNAEELDLRIIGDAVYMGMKNDVSFLLDQVMSLWEQQSSYNPNMPLRFLLYYAHMMERYIRQLNPMAQYRRNRNGMLGLQELCCSLTLKEDHHADVYFKNFYNYQPHDGEDPVPTPVPQVVPVDVVPDPSPYNPGSNSGGLIDEYGNLIDEDGNLISEDGSVNSRTGDDSLIGLYAAAAMASAALLAAWFVLYRRRREQN